MTRDEIISMARASGLVIVPNANPISMQGLVSELEHFAALVAAAEREACATACQAVIDGGQYDEYQQYAAAACRDEIRARGEKGQS